MAPGFEHLNAEVDDAQAQPEASRTEEGAGTTVACPVVEGRPGGRDFRCWDRENRRFTGGPPTLSIGG